MKTNTLASYKQQYKQRIKGRKPLTNEEVQAREKALQHFEKMQKTRALMHCSFDMIDGDGNLIFVDDNQIEYFLSEEDLATAYPTYTKETRSAMLGVPIQVYIKEIQNTRVILESASVFVPVEERRKELERILSYRVYHKNYPEIMGTVTEVQPNRVFVDIFDSGVIGIIPTLYFRKEFTRDLRQFFKVGEVITGRVVKKKSRTEGEERHWIISTVKYTQDPWKNIPPNITEDSIINIKCIQIPQGKTYFWGVSNLVPGIEIMSDFGGGKLQIEVGGIYKCKIRKISVEEKKFQVVPFGVVSNRYLNSLTEVKKKGNEKR